MDMRIRLVSAVAIISFGCSDSVPDSPSTAPSGGLSLEVPTLALDVDSAEFAITGAGISTPVIGEMVPVDGALTAQIAGIPSGDGRRVHVRMMKAGQVVCEAGVDTVSIPAGLAAQALLLPDCVDPASNLGRASKQNRAPQIKAVVASRKNAALKDQVAIAVSAFDKDGDSVTYGWTESITGFGFADKKAAATIWTAGPLGAKNKLTVTVKDGKGGSASAALVVKVDGFVSEGATCANPYRVKLGETITGMTIGAQNKQTPIGCNVGTGAPDRVFKLQLRQTTTFSVTTGGSFFGAQVYVRKGSCTAGDAELGCAEPFSGGMTFTDAAPGAYFIIVDGANTFDQGEFVLSVVEGGVPELCNNGVDDDGDGQFDCADDTCVGEQGCLDCLASCDATPGDCIGGQCDRFSGHCFAFLEFGVACDLDGTPASLEGICLGDGGCQENTAVCGNGQFEFGEECDDGNTIGGDGCEADCKQTRCGTSICFDGNPCTLDLCTDPATSLCEFTAAPDGTVCEGDGVPETADTCQAGVCVIQPPPRPDAALIILDPIVLEDPAFSLQAMHDRLATDGNGSALFEQWATTLTQPITVSTGRGAAARDGFTTFLAGLPRSPDGRIDLDAAGFTASAFVNRLDLRQDSDCGESRVVFTKESGVTDGADRMTIIFEFHVPDDGSNCVTISERWAALRGLEGEALRAAAVQLMIDNSQVHLLNQMRTNEFINEPFWELREFHLVDGMLQPFPVVDTVDFALGPDADFRAFVLANAGVLNAAVTGSIAPNFLEAASRADGSRVQIGLLIPTLPGLEANLNSLTCSGCHLTETQTSFVHVIERVTGTPSNLSQFLRGDLRRRAAVLESVIGPAVP
jgi:cysteine-rich repeat protein